MGVPVRSQKQPEKGFRPVSLFGDLPRSRSRGQVRTLPVLVLMAGFLAGGTMTAHGQYTPPTITGNLDTLNSYFESPDESINIFSQHWNLVIEDQLPNGDLIGVDFTGTWDRSSERDYINFFPSVGLTLEGSDYRFRTRYSRFEDKGFLLETGVLTQEHWETELLLPDLVVDEIRLSYETDRSYDDFDPHFVNTKNTRFIAGFTHRFEDLSILDSLRIGAQHWEERFENNVESDVRIPFNLPVTLDEHAGSIYVADAGAGVIVVLTTGLTFVRSIGLNTGGTGPLREPRGVVVDDQGRIYVADSGQHRILRFREDGTFDRFWGTGASSAEGQFNQPRELAIGPDGTVYVADFGNRRIQRLRPGAAEFEVFVTGGLVQPTGLAVDSQNRVYVTDRNLDKVFRFSQSGFLDLSWGTPGVGPGEFDSPSSISVDDTLFVYVTDTRNNRIQKFTSDGVFLSQWGTAPAEGPLRFPEGIDAGGAFLYVADTVNGLIRKYDRGGNLIQSSVDAQAGWTETSDDSFSTDFSLSPTDWWSLYGTYVGHYLQFENESGSNSQTWTHDGALHSILELTEFWTLSGGATARYRGTKREDVINSIPPQVQRTDDWQLDLTEFASTNLQLRENIQVGLSHSESQFYENGDKNSANRTTSGFVSSRLLELLDLDVRASHLETELLGETDNITDSWGYTLRGLLAEQTHLTWSHDFSDSDQFLDTGVTNTKIETGKLDIDSQITLRTFGRLSFTTTRTESRSFLVSRHSQFETIGIDLSYYPNSFFYTTGEVRHVIGDPGFLREWLFSGTMGLRWGDRYNLLTTYTDFRDGTRTRDWSIRLTIKLRPRSTLELDYDVFDDRDAGTTETANARLVVTF